MNSWFFILGMFLVSFIPRTFPIFILKDREISPQVQNFLNFVPVSIFTALVAADIFFWNGQFSFNIFTNVKLLSSLVVLLVSLKFRNLFLSMLVGVVTIALLTYLL